MIIVKSLGLQPYLSVWGSMKSFTINRQDTTDDELWLLEHPAVYTQGQAGRPEHVLNPGMIPVVQSDRGGQVTYHGPGQLVGYVLMDIQRRHLGVRSLVCALEKCLIALLDEYGVQGHLKCGAPGVYVDDAKIASIGLRVKNGRTYHGIALNVKMDLSPFNNINPCGFAKLTMTQLSHYIDNLSMTDVASRFQRLLLQQFDS